MARPRVLRSKKYGQKFLIKKDKHGNEYVAQCLDVGRITQYHFDTTDPWRSYPAPRVIHRDRSDKNEY